MVVGVTVAAYYIKMKRSGDQCAVDTELLISCGVMYSTYLYLFGEVSTCTRGGGAARRRTAGW
jgi:hypothetical protein